jgi:hypothetical protein
MRKSSCSTDRLNRQYSKKRNQFGLGFELNAILAVVIGGTLMSGGRFSLLATMIGGLVMEAVITTMYTIGVSTNSITPINAMVVILINLLYSNQSKNLIRRLTGQEEAALIMLDARRKRTQSHAKRITVWADKKYDYRALVDAVRE